MDYRPDSFFVKIYQSSPIFLQNLFFSIAGFKNYYQRYNRHFFRHLDFLKESEWWNEKQIADYQNVKFLETVHHGFDVSPFIRYQFEKANLKPADIRGIEDIRKIPISSKNDLRDSGKAYFNEKLGARHLIKGLTSGTSGRALQTYHSSESLAAQWAVWARHKERFGIRLGDKHLSFGARVPIDARQEKPPFWRWNYAAKQMYLSTFHLSNRHLPSIVEFLNTTSFDYYLGYPSAMYVVAKYMEENGIHLRMRPKYIVTGSDALLLNFEKTIRKSFGVPVTEQYGMAESCGNLSKCEFGKFHLDFEFGFAELLDIEGDNNGKFKKLVFTGFMNDAMPLIRYDIGDYVEPEGTPCHCGRKSMTVKSILGRLEDYVVTPDGRHVSGLNQVFEWANTVREIQIIQEDSSMITVNYVPASSFNIADLDFLEVEFRKRLGSEIIINYSKVIEIARSRSGKYKAVVSKVGKIG